MPNHTSKPKRRWASWSAVSSLPQAKKISLDEQRAENDRHIVRHGGQKVADLVVPGESRDIVLFDDACQRIEAYAHLRDLLAAGSIDVLICLNRSRLGRTLALVETIAELCRRSGVIIYETESPPATLTDDGNTFDNLLLGAIKSAGAQREIAEIQRRHAMGMMGKLQRGEFLNGIPWGWRAVYSPDGARHIEIDPNAAAIIRFIFVEMYLGQGYGTPAIAEALNQRGWSTPQGRPWTASRVGMLFSMAWRYAGYGEINAWSKHRPYARAKGSWPAILTDQELEAVLTQRELRRGARGAMRTREYRWSLMVWCAECGKKMSMNHLVTRKPSGKVYHYSLASCDNQPYHPKRHIMESRITEAVRAVFLRLQDSSTWPDYLEDTSGDDQLAATQIERLRKEIADLHEQIFRADDHLLDGTFTIERHAYQVKRLHASIARLEGDIAAIEARRESLRHTAARQERLAEIATHGMSYLDSVSPRQANAKLRQLLRVWVKAGQVIEVEIL